MAGWFDVPVSDLAFLLVHVSGKVKRHIGRSLCGIATIKRPEKDLQASSASFVCTADIEKNTDTDTDTDADTFSRCAEIAEVMRAPYMQNTYSVYSK